MSTDREAVIWTRLGGTPRRMGRLYVTDKECRFTYDDDYLEQDLPGVGLVYAPEYYGKTTISRERTERFNLLPPLQSLIPPRQEDNFQRNLALKYLATKGITTKSITTKGINGLNGFDTDWEILKISGHGGIGHIDLFESDKIAESWYNNPPVHSLTEVSDQLSFSLKEFMTWFEEDIEILIQTVGPTPSVGGAIPKLLLSIPSSGWDGRIGLPTRQKTLGATDVVLKFEQSNRYPGIIELEALALDIHREAGFKVPRHWVCNFKGMPALAVERFDRDENNTPLYTESLYSILASGAPLNNHFDYQYDLIAEAFDKSAVRIVSEPTKEKEHLFKRLILAMLTGNGDLHLENLSIYDKDNNRGFTPIYDPAPMRAYSQHDMLSVMPFGQYGELVDKQDTPVKLVEAVQRFAHHSGISNNRCHELVHELLESSKDFTERVGELNTVPDENKTRLITRVNDVRKKLEQLDHD
jgi:serine/threonine-protein kinase HipA